MRYCISGRQPKSVLKKTDDIRLFYKDTGVLIEYAVEFADKHFLIEMVGVRPEEINWDLLSTYAKEIDITLAFNLLEESCVNKCKELGIKFCYNPPVYTWSDLTALVNLGVSSIWITDKLFFELDKVRKKVGNDIEIRITPNRTFNNHIIRDNGIFAPWLRPEDVDTYAQWVDVIEFYESELSKEATLLNIYKEQKNWPGNLNLLIQDLGVNVDNRGIPEEIGELRANCGLRCMEDGGCRFCETALRFSNALRKRRSANNEANLSESTEEN